MLIFPDVEAEVRSYLLDAMEAEWPDLRVVMAVPDDVDWQTDQPVMVVVTVTGTGAARDVVYERVLIGFECYAPTQERASLLARTVRAHVGHWPAVSGMVSGQDDNARPTRSSQDDVDYPAYWYSSNVNFKAHNI